MSMIAEDAELDMLRAAYLSWEFDRIPATSETPALLVARRGGYEARAIDGDRLRRSIIEWMTGGGLTGAEPRLKGDPS